MILQFNNLESEINDKLEDSYDWYSKEEIKEDILSIDEFDDFEDQKDAYIATLNDENYDCIETIRNGFRAWVGLDEIEF